jgi:2-amino-4-hydroxy-6-hydroxymethyldihydropteridine diphosphokinase
VVLGANLKHPKKQINEAITRIGQFATVQKTSEFYFSKPYGMEGGNDFVNRAIIISTELLPDQFLERILTIEANMGRIRADKWISRIIDIDILFWGQLCHRDDGLTIPHHDYLNRDFFFASGRRNCTGFYTTNAITVTERIAKPVPDSSGVQKRTGLRICLGI